MPAETRVEKLTVALLEEATKQGDGPVERIVIRPNGEIEVNAQVYRRGQREPDVIFVTV